MRIEAEGIDVHLGQVHALDGVDFSVNAGEMVGLIGPNGSGKTTLLRVIANLQSCSQGTVRFSGRTAADVGPAALSRQLAYLPQANEVYWPMQVEALVALGRLPHRRSFWSAVAPNDLAVQRAMVATDVLALRGRTMSQLSGGERMRVLLARALAVEAPFLLADEPVAALDPLHQLQVMALLRRSVQSGGGVVVVLHDLALAARFCDRVTLLSHGSVLASGPPDRVMTDDNLAAAFGVEVAWGERNGQSFPVPWAPVQ